jgi:hypothetical protein
MNKYFSANHHAVIWLTDSQGVDYCNEVDTQYVNDMQWRTAVSLNRRAAARYVIRGTGLSSYKKRIYRAAVSQSHWRTVTQVQEQAKTHNSSD